MADISVIVPVYKVESYLPRCVDSVLNQTFENLELILVDDGSPDGCPEICDSYADKDSRVHVLHQKNGGLSAARNAALDWIMEKSSSRWIFFLDSDDWIHPETLLRLRAAAEEYGTSVCVGGYQDTDGEMKAIVSENLKPELWNTEKFYTEKCTNATIACGKLYRKECFRNLRYPVGRLHEDEFVTYRILFAEKKLTYLPAAFYCYYVNPDSITRRLWNPHRLDVWKALEEQQVFFQENGYSDAADNCMHRYLCNAYSQLREIRQCGDPVQYRAEDKMVREKARALLKACTEKKIVDFDSSFLIRKELYPVRTSLQMYWNSLCRRLHLRR